MHGRIGYCPENPYFYDYLTASELMNYFGELFGFDSGRRKVKASELLTQVGLDERDWNKQLRKFSKGMLQRVGLAQALINDPELVFLDEPMSGLDPVGRRDVRDLIANLRSTGTTVFMSTHILSDAESLCDEVAILAGGRLAAMGKITSLLSENARPREFEILIDALDIANAKAALGSNSEVRLDPTATGVRAFTTNEEAIGDLISALTRAGGSFVSATPLKQSLEDIFVERTRG
jgi:ABC-2 type transport system ATP-binding protein